MGAIRVTATRALLAGPLLAALALLTWLLRLPAGEAQVAAFSTSLRGRTQSQVHNVRLALAALDGQVVPPGKVLSFNRVVGPWTQDRGYRRAPVSYAGEMTLDWGGGVCQAATTLYNAVLLAGLPIIERHRHHWLATYVPPGQDAAVAYPSLDLRFRSSLRAPLRVAARVEGESLVVRLYSRDRPPPVSIERRVLAVTRPATVARPSPGPSPRVIEGRSGCQVVVYRRFQGEEARAELISRDSYPAQNRVVWR